MKRLKILYVDDEPINLSNFTMAFQDDFDILAASSGAEALEMFHQQVGDGLAVVVADQRMPGMSGVELLSRIYAIDPDPVRIVLTAYADFVNIRAAVNQGHIYQYIQKPWEYEGLKLILQRAGQVYALNKENQNLVAELGARNRQLLEANEALARELACRKEQEEQRRNAEVRALAQAKLASLGEMATGVAHEINQPLSYIRVMLAATRDDFENGRLDPAEFVGDLAEALRQVGRISTIVDHLRTFGRDSGQEFGSVDLPQVVARALVLLRQRLKVASILLEQEVEDGLPLVRGIASQLEQVFINLVVNAMDAMQGRASRKLSIRLARDGDAVCAVVADSGCGMSEEVRARIFEPFFTTKEVGKGTGIGLAIVYGIVTGHHGCIQCSSTPGEGTRFTLTLPAALPANRQTVGLGQRV